MLVRILLLLLLVSLQRPQQTPPPHRVYLPIVLTHRVLVEDLRPGRPEVCMAWVPGTLVERSQDDFGGTLFYHSGSHQPGAIAQGGIPVWRSPYVPNYYLSVPSTLRFNNHDGIVKLFNEPDLRGQDGKLTPQDAAALYRTAKLLLPAAAFVTPNAVSRDYLFEFMAAVGNDWREGWDIIGVHGYEVYSTASLSPAEWLEPVFDLAHEYRSHVWVSEVGIDSSWTIAARIRFINEFDDPRLQAVCWYSPHCAGYSPEACGHNFYEDDYLNLTSTGRILQEIVHGGQWPPDPPGTPGTPQ